MRNTRWANCTLQLLDEQIHRSSYRITFGCVRGSFSIRTYYHTDTKTQKDTHRDTRTNGHTQTHTDTHRHNPTQRDTHRHTDTVTIHGGDAPNRPRRCTITSLATGGILVPYVPRGKLRFGASLVQVANEVASQLLRRGGDQDSEGVVCVWCVGTSYDDAALSARGQTRVLTHGGDQGSGGNLAKPGWQSTERSECRTPLAACHHK